MFKKVLSIGITLALLSLSVAATKAQAEPFDSVKSVVKSALDKTSVMVLDNEPVNSTFDIVAVDAFGIERIHNVTGENTQLIDLAIDEAIELSFHKANLATATLLPQEVGWKF